MKRFGVRRSARYGGALAILAIVGLTLFVVLPALASNLNDKVPPSSGAGIMPVDVNVGGAQTCSSLFPTMTGVQQTFDPSPATGPYPSGSGWNFSLTLGALPGFSANKGQSLAVSSNGNAAILGIGIKGGTDNLIYDYRTLPQGWVSGDTILHAPAAAGKWTPGTNPEANISQYYGVSQLVICYKTPLSTISGKAYKDISGQPAIPGLTATLTDTTTSKTQTTPTDANGNYSFSAIQGDNYTVCISAPSFNNVQTVPADQTGGACAPTSGYSITNLSGSVTGENFGFQPLSSVGGRVYNDLSNPANAKYDGSPPDSPQSNWKVTLYKNNVAPPGAPVWQQVDQQTSDNNGLYNFANDLMPGGDYLVCERAPSGDQTLWGQSQPIPTSTSQCTSPDLEYGYRFTAPSTNITNDDFGNIAGVPESTCPPAQPFGGDQTNGQLQLQLATCKPNQIFVFNMAAAGDPNAPWVSVFAADQTQPEIPLIEKVVFADPIVNGTPTLQHLAYTDTFPYDITKTKPMPYCQLDPRDPSDLSGMTLASAYMDDSTKNSVLPNDIGTNTKATSCAISIRTYVDAQGNGHLEGYVYTDIDGLTKGTN